LPHLCYPACRRDAHWFADLLLRETALVHLVDQAHACAEVVCDDPRQFRQRGPWDVPLSSIMRRIRCTRCRIALAFRPCKATSVRALCPDTKYEAPPGNRSRKHNVVAGPKAAAGRGRQGEPAELVLDRATATRGERGVPAEGASSVGRPAPGGVGGGAGGGSGGRGGGGEDAPRSPPRPSELPALLGTITPPSPPLFALRGKGGGRQPARSETLAGNSVTRGQHATSHGEAPLAGFGSVGRRETQPPLNGAFISTPPGPTWHSGVAAKRTPEPDGHRGK